MKRGSLGEADGEEMIHSEAKAQCLSSTYEYCVFERLEVVVFLSRVHWVSRETAGPCQA